MTTPRISRDTFEGMVKGSLKGRGKFMPKKMKRIVRNMYSKSPGMATKGLGRKVAIKKLKQAIAAGKEAGVKFKHKPSTSLGTRRTVATTMKRLKTESSFTNRYTGGANKELTPQEKRREEALKNMHKSERAKEIAAETEAEKAGFNKDTPKREALSREHVMFGAQGKSATASVMGKSETVASVGQISNDSKSSTNNDDDDSTSQQLPDMFIGG